MAKKRPVEVLEHFRDRMIKELPKLDALIGKRGGKKLGVEVVKRSKR